MDERKKALHLDIDRYMHRRRRMDPKEAQKTDVSLDTYDETPKEGFFKRLFAGFKRKSKTETIETDSHPEFEQGEPEPMNEKQGFLKSLLSIFIKQEKIIEELPAEAEPELVDDAKDDLKDLAKLFLKTLEKMPEKELKSFKATEEFGQFKKILRKHNVIK